MIEHEDINEYKIKYLESRVEELEREVTSQREEIYRLERRLDSQYNRIDTKLFKMDGHLFQIENGLPWYMLALAALGIGATTAVYLIRALHETFTELIGG